MKSVRLYMPALQAAVRRQDRVKRVVADYYPSLSFIACGGRRDRSKHNISPVRFLSLI